MPLQNDQTAVLELLRERGPLEFDELRTQLCWASRTRLAAALWVLQGTGEVDYLAVAFGSFYRRADDTRTPEIRAQHRHHAGKVMS